MIERAPAGWFHPARQNPVAPSWSAAASTAGKGGRPASAKSGPRRPSRSTAHARVSGGGVGSGGVVEVVDLAAGCLCPGVDDGGDGVGASGDAGEVFVAAGECLVGVLVVEGAGTAALA